MKSLWATMLKGELLSVLRSRVCRRGPAAVVGGIEVTPISAPIGGVVDKVQEPSSLV